MPVPYRMQLQQATEAALNGATVVTANTRASRELLGVCDQRRKAGAGAWRTPSVLPFGAWVGELWQSAQASGALDQILLGPLQQQALWTRIIEESPSSSALLNGRELAGLASQAWEAMHAYSVPWRSSEFRGTVESRSLLDWANAYRDVTFANRWLDPARRLDRLAALLPSLKSLLPKSMIFAGFDQLTPQQRNFIAALTLQGVSVTILSAEPAGAIAGDAIRSVRLADRSAELTMAARWARAYLERDPSANLGVVIAGLPERKEATEQIFSAILHPEQYFAVRDISQPAFDISLGRALADYPVMRSALIFLRLLSASVPLADFSAWLRSPYFGAVGDEGGKRAQLDWFLSQVLPPSVTLESVLAALAKAAAQGFTTAGVTARLQAARQLLTHTLSPMRSPNHQSPNHQSPNHRSPNQWISDITALLAAARWPAEADGLVLTSDEYQAREAWENLCDEVGSLDLVRPPMAFAEVVAALVEASSARIFKPRNQRAPVQVMGELEAAGSSFDALWIAGWSDDAWPPRGAPNPLIPIALQREYRLPHSSAESDLAFAASVSDRLLQSAPRVTVSWPAGEEDRQLRPSPLAVSLPVVGCDDLGVPSAKGLAELFPTVALESVQDYRAPAVAVGELRSRGTRLVEQQSNCPFRAFVELRLLAAQARRVEPGLTPANRGKLVETALQYAWNELHDKSTLETLDEQRLQAIISAAVESAFTLLNLKPADAWEMRYLDLERQRLAALVREWLQFERGREDFREVRHQQEIRFQLAGLDMRGFIDRLDRLPDGSLVVIDYKTGSQSYRPGDWSTPRPARPQLPLYATALLGTPGAKLSAVAFASVNRGGCRMAGAAVRPEILGAKSLRGPELQAYLDQWGPELEALVAAFLRGDARIDPKHAPGYPSRSTCDATYCHLRAVCRMAEIDFPPPAEEEDPDERD